MHECDSVNNCKKKHCPYYHSESEIRKAPPADMKLYPRNRGYASGLSSQYSIDYLLVMFNELRRVDRVLPHRKNNAQPYPMQEIYGCGPQSTPIIDPQIVLAFQKFLLANQSPDIFSLTIGSQTS